MLSFIIIIVILIIIIIVLSIKYNTKKCPIPSQSQCDDTFPSSQLNFENCSREFPTTKDQCDKFITRENCGNKYNGPSADNCKNFINKESCDSHITAGNCSKFITKPNCDKFITEENCKDKYEVPSETSCSDFINKETCNFLITKPNCDKFITADNCYNKVPSIGVKPINLANCFAKLGSTPSTHWGNARSSSDPFWNKTCTDVCSAEKDEVDTTISKKCIDNSSIGGDSLEDLKDPKNIIDCNVKKKYMKCICGTPATPTTTA